jgi:hypothetical protein
MTVAVERMGATIRFPPTESAEKIQASKGRLYDQAKITFDTGYGLDGFDWELDWSFEHPYTDRDMAMTFVKNTLKEANLEYQIIYRPYQDVE